MEIIIKKLIYSDMVRTFLYGMLFLVISPITLYSRNVLSKTKILSMVVIWINRKDLINHGIYKQLKLLRAIKLPPSILNLGKKILFTELKQIEVKLFISMLTQFTNSLTKTEDYPGETGIKRTLKQFVSYLKGYKKFNNIDIIVSMMECYEDHIEALPEIFTNAIKKDIMVYKADIIHYIKNHEETLDLSEEEVKQIKEEIQVKKARTIVQLYEEMMLVYRKQIISNLISQLNSNKPTHLLLGDILENSLTPVYRNMMDIIHIYINKLNGELKNIDYKGHKLH